ncbi:MAG: DUF2169 domain-containing protein, partial [Deltaproteobacteria bacterium]|nr:DUF2169 domain-containing protein [Deltaproteobacteria bacterium]
MDKLVQEPLIVSAAAFRHAGRDYLAVSAMAGFRLAGGLLSAPEALAAAVQSLTPLAAQGVGLDSGLAKPSGEFLAKASAYAPPESLSESVTVTLSVGELKRSFLAQGERYGDNPPLPFKSLPLGWSQAAFDPLRNPFGIEPGTTLGSKGQPLSSFLVGELADGGGPGPHLAPASPLPAPFNFERMIIPGTYDDNWLKNFWPGFPGDYDYSRQNAAQPPQRLSSGYFEGSEAIEAVNAHPTIPVLTGSLPGLRLRLLFLADKGTHLSLREADPVLDTVWLFPDLECGLVIWHSNVAVEDEKASGLGRLIAVLEPLSSPKADPGEIAAASFGGFKPFEPGAAFLSPAAWKLPEKDSRPEPQAGSIAPEAGQPDSKGPEASLGEAGQPESANHKMEADSPEDPPKAKPVIIETPDSSGLPEPPASIPLPQAPPALSAEELLAMTLEKAADNLPKINEVLAKRAIKPLTTGEISARFQKFRTLPGQPLQSRPPSGSDSAMEDSLAAKAEDFEKAGLSKDKAKKLASLLAEPELLPGAFAKPANFVKSVENFADRFADYLGVSPNVAQLVSEIIHTKAAIADLRSADHDPAESFSKLRSLLPALRLPSHSPAERNERKPRPQGKKGKPPPSKSAKSRAVKQNKLIEQFIDLQKRGLDLAMSGVSPQHFEALNGFIESVFHILDNPVSKMEASHALMRAITKFERSLDLPSGYLNDKYALNKALSSDLRSPAEDEDAQQSQPLSQVIASQVDIENISIPILIQTAIESVLKDYKGPAALTRAGLSPDQASALNEVLDKIAMAAGSSATPSEAAEALTALAPELDQAMSLPPGTMAKKIDRDAAQMRYRAWSDPGVVKALESLSKIHPELKEKLDKLAIACQNKRPAKSSLADLAKEAGIDSPKALAAIAGLDLLNSPRPIPPAAPASRVPPSPDTGPIAPQEGDESEALEDKLLTRAFNTRDDLSAWLKDNPLPASMSGFCLAGLNLNSLNLAGRDLSWADLRG